jgi:hypothetical protein
MENPLKELVEHLDYDELLEINKELKKDSLAIKKMLTQQIARKQREHGEYCVTCFAEIKAEDNAYTLLFGPASFRKKASFCATDCLKYFLASLNTKIKKKEELHSN